MAICITVLMFLLFCYYLTLWNGHEITIMLLPRAHRHLVDISVILIDSQHTCGANKMCLNILLFLAVSIDCFDSGLSLMRSVQYVFWTVNELCKCINSFLSATILLNVWSTLNARHLNLLWNLQKKLKPWQT